MVCRVRVGTIEHPLMQKICYIDNLVDELARCEAVAKIVRGAGALTQL